MAAFRSFRRPSLILVSFLIPIAAAACNDDAPDAGQSNGTTAAPVDTLAVSAVVGGMDTANPELEFGRLAGVTLLPGGGVAVADLVKDAVRIFTSGGELRYSVGRSGSGPGELAGPCCLAIDGEGRLWVRDGGNARYNVYVLSPDGAVFVDQIPMSHGDRNRFAPTTFDDAGRVIDIGTRNEPDSEGRRVARMRLDSTGTITSTVYLHEPPPDSTATRSVRRSTANGFSIRYAHQPFGPQPRTAHSPTGEYAHALTSRYAIDWRDETGELIRHIEGDIAAGPELSDTERVTGRERMESQAEFIGVAVGRLGFDVPERKTPLQDLFFDNVGRLWVEISAADGELPAAHVYGTDGQLEQIVRWPRGIDLRDGAMHGDVAWGIGRDSLGVATLVKLIAPEPAP